VVLTSDFIFRFLVDASELLASSFALFFSSNADFFFVKKAICILLVLSRTHVRFEQSAPGGRQRGADADERASRPIFPSNVRADRAE
jgi:hypothetical protein